MVRFYGLAVQAASIQLQIISIKDLFRTLFNPYLVIGDWLKIFESKIFGP